MTTQLSLKELEMLKISLESSIMNVENSQNYTPETYPHKRKKLGQLGELKSKLSQMQNEIKK